MPHGHPAACLRRHARRAGRGAQRQGRRASCLHPSLTGDSCLPDYDFAQQVGHLLRKAYQRHLAIFQANSADPRLTSVQFATLCALRDHGESTQAELIRATAIDQATIRGIIERLHARDLIDFVADPDDRRKTIVRLTESGQATVSAMIPRARDITELTMGDLDPVERVALLHLLRKMIRAA